MVSDGASGTVFGGPSGAAPGDGRPGAGESGVSSESSEEAGPGTAFAGVPSVVPRPVEELRPLLEWLRTGRAAPRRLDFAAGTALPDGRLDLCKQQLGPGGAAEVARALRPDGPVRHLLLGTDGLGDAGAAAVAERAGEAGVETLYLGCNTLTSAGVCSLADNLRASPSAVTGVWLKRNPLGAGAGDAAARLLAQVRELRTLDLVQTGLEPSGAAALAEALVAAARDGRPVERLYAGGNPLGPAGARALAPVVAAGACGELYLAAAGLGDAGAAELTGALERAPFGRLRRLSVASDGIGAPAAGRLVAAAVHAGVELCDLGRVKAARALGAADNRFDETAAASVGAALAAGPHRLTHLVLTHTGATSAAAHRLLDSARCAVTPTRFRFGSGVARSVKRRLDALSAEVAPLPVPAAVAAIRSVHRQPLPGPGTAPD